MRSLQIQARALGDPTRHRIFEYVVHAERPVGVAELTDHLGLNHNAIRQHLAKLVDAELVLESNAPPSGRGRPRLQYIVDPATDSRWGVTGPYERLSVLLAEVVRTGDDPVQVGRRAALREPAEGDVGSPAEGDVGGPAEVHVGDPVGALVDQMARQGFAPEVRRQGDLVDITLQECPFTSAALTDAETVCGLHLGLARGVAESIGGITVEDLVPADPRTAHCQLRCRVDAD